MIIEIVDEEYDLTITEITERVQERIGYSPLPAVDPTGPDRCQLNLMLTVSYPDQWDLEHR